MHLFWENTNNSYDAAITKKPRTDDDDPAVNPACLQPHSVYDTPFLLLYLELHCNNKYMSAIHGICNQRPGKHYRARYSSTRPTLCHDATYSPPLALVLGRRGSGAHLATRAKVVRNNRYHQKSLHRRHMNPNDMTVYSDLRIQRTSGVMLSQSAKAQRYVSRSVSTSLVHGLLTLLPRPWMVSPATCNRSYSRFM